MSHVISSSKPLVFDLGSIYLKCGFAGECSPRHMHCWEIWKYHDHIPRLNTTSWIELISPIFTSICYKYLQLKPKGRHVILIEDLISATTFREAVAYVFFNHLKVASIVFVPAASVAVLAGGYHTALVIDCGWRLTRVLPIYKDLILTPAYQCIPKGSLFLCKEIKKILENSLVSETETKGNKSELKVKDKEKDQLLFNDMMEIDDILVRCCKVKSLKNTEDQMVSTVLYPIKGNNSITLSEDIVSLVTSKLFEVIDDGNSIAEAILESLLKTSLILRPSLLHNILLIGGTSNLTGFKERLMEQMQYEVENNTRYSSLQVLIDSPSIPRFLSCPFATNLMSWTGASILGTIETSSKTVLTAEEYHKNNDKIGDNLYSDQLEQKSSSL